MASAAVIKKFEKMEATLKYLQQEFVAARTILEGESSPSLLGGQKKVSTAVLKRNERLFGNKVKKKK